MRGLRWVGCVSGSVTRANSVSGNVIRTNNVSGNVIRANSVSVSVSRANSVSGSVSRADNVWGGVTVLVHSIGQPSVATSKILKAGFSPTYPGTPKNLGVMPKNAFKARPTQVFFYQVFF